MDRAFLSGASGSPPAAPASPSVGYPSAGNPSTGTPPTKPGPYWFHMVTEELRAVIAAAGVTPDPTALDQLARAIQSGRLAAAAAAGTADAITASYTPAIAALTDRMVLRVRAGSANTTATPTFAPNGLAAKAIVKGNNLPLVAGDIAGAGHWLELQYDQALDRWVLQNPALGVVALQYASNAEAQALTIANKAISPATLAEALKGANQSLAASGYQKLPGGLILQWGVSGAVAYNATGQTITFPIAFPSSCAAISHMCGGSYGTGTVLAINFQSITATNFTYQASTNASSGTYGFRWIAIGY